MALAHLLFHHLPPIGSHIYQPLEQMILRSLLTNLQLPIKKLHNFFSFFFKYFFVSRPKNLVSPRHLFSDNQYIPDQGSDHRRKCQEENKATGRDDAIKNRQNVLEDLP